MPTGMRGSSRRRPTSCWRGVPPRDRSRSRRAHCAHLVSRPPMPRGRTISTREHQHVLGEQRRTGAEVLGRQRLGEPDQDRGDDGAGTQPRPPAAPSRDPSRAAGAGEGADEVGRRQQHRRQPGHRAADPSSRPWRSSAPRRRPAPRPPGSASSRASGCRAAIALIQVRRQHRAASRRRSRRAIPSSASARLQLRPVSDAGDGVEDLRQRLLDPAERRAGTSARRSRWRAWRSASGSGSSAGRGAG